MNFLYLYILAVVIVWCLVLGIIAANRYKADKEYAQKGDWRVPEKELLLEGILGGAFGAYYAMQKYRHKTKHWYFSFTNILGMIIWSLIAVVLIIMFFIAK
ncbi:hypothetical protein WA158_004612 [Blastocystis sp. Blastoise]